MNSTFIPVSFSRYLPSGANLRWSSVGASSGIAETFKTGCWPCATPTTAAKIAIRALLKTKEATPGMGPTPVVIEMQIRARARARTVVQSYVCMRIVAMSLHRHIRAARMHLADDGSVREAIAAEYGEDVVHRFTGAGHQQPAAGLR